jgi:hypothetical protein
MSNDRAPMEGINPQYKSVERKILESDFVRNFVPVAYGAVASLFRLPTTVRKLVNNQQINSLNDFDLTSNISSSQLAARLTGAIAGLCAAGYVVNHVIDEAIKGNYTPLAVMAITNALSFAYECDRGELFNNKRSNQ